MSLIIEGMNIPEYRDVFGDERGCVYLLMLTVNKDGTASMQFNDVDGGFYRVKEIRTPHGRLIDCESKSFPIAFGHESTDYAKGWNACLRRVHFSPTIIEAEAPDNA